MDKAGVQSASFKTFDSVRDARKRIAKLCEIDDSQRINDFPVVVVILSSSRGGSSALFSALRATKVFWCLPGEHVYLYKLHGFGLPDDPLAHDGSIGPGADLDGLLSALATECTGPISGVLTANLVAYHFVSRLLAQWPMLADDPDLVLEAARRQVYRQGSCHDPVALLMAIIRELRDIGYAVDPWYYDLPANVISRWFPAEPEPVGPPSAGFTLVEEPPFLVPRAFPARPALASSQRRPLLLKASLDVYRINLIRRLFPASELRFVHLTRNPAASINGLMDGWLSRGFFSHQIDRNYAMNIEGYSHLPWGQGWWNFDLPPQWYANTATSLPRVCSFQWRQAHQHILAAKAEGAGTWLQVRAEDLHVSSGRQRALVHRVMKFAGVDSPMASEVGELPVVMATAPPRPGRWRANAERIAAAIEEEETQDVAGALGYGSRPTLEWL
ncbi:sulfotransferase [Salinispora mooreana]|uniref:sulfotransferase n=1 Tax=Salinispora mooreana TaxID=999545 RepID=UPI0013A57397|nr:sulfotransferase [Salinispora mooreana]